MSEQTPAGARDVHAGIHTPPSLTPQCAAPTMAHVSTLRIGLLTIGVLTRRGNYEKGRGEAFQ